MRAWDKIWAYKPKTTSTIPFWWITGWDLTGQMLTHLHSKSKQAWRVASLAKSLKHLTKYLMHRIFRTTFTSIWWTGEQTTSLLSASTERSTFGVLALLKSKNCANFPLTILSRAWDGAIEVSISPLEPIAETLKSGTPITAKWSEAKLATSEGSAPFHGTGRLFPLVQGTEQSCQETWELGIAWPTNILDTNKKFAA